MNKDHICPTCGWNALDEEGVDAGDCEVVNCQDTWTDFGPGAEFQVECICPECGQIFEFCDGYP